MSVWPNTRPLVPSLSTAEGALVSVSIHVEPHCLESLLEALALVSFPINPQIYHDAALIYGYAESLYSGRQYDQALLFLDAQQQLNASDYKLYGLQAKTYAALGKRLQQHRAQAEFYMLRGQLGEAVEQLRFAQQDSDGNFYEQSAVDARLRELRKLQAEEAKEKRNSG